jgi:hypothetical protein
VQVTVGCFPGAEHQDPAEDPGRPSAFKAATPDAGLAPCSLIDICRYWRVGISEEFAEPLGDLLRSDTTVAGLQEVQLFDQFVRSLILLRWVIPGLAVVVHLHVDRIGLRH